MFDKESVLVGEDIHVGTVCEHLQQCRFVLFAPDECQETCVCLAPNVYAGVLFI